MGSGCRIFSFSLFLSFILSRKGIDNREITHIGGLDVNRIKYSVN